MSSFYNFLKSKHHTNKQLEPTRTQQSNCVIAKLNVEKSLRLFKSAYYKIYMRISLKSFPKLWSSALSYVILFS